MRNTYKITLTVFVVFLVFSSCSRKNTGFLSKNFRALSAEYNALYNGNLALEQGKKALAQSYRDDFWEILPVERVQLNDEIMLPGASKNVDFERAEEKAAKAIQKHSIYVDGKEHNPQIDEAYMLLGKARYFDSRFIPAIEAFNYILSKYPTSNSINSAKIWREKTNIRLENEEIALNNLRSLFETASLEDEEYADASAMMAQAFINLESLDSAVVYISDAAAHTKDTEKKGRYLYIKGQLYNRLDQKDSANLAFDQVIAFNRKVPRQLLINAQIEKAHNFDYEKGDRQAFRELLAELAEDRENRPFLDIIFNQNAVYYQRTDSIDAAIVYFNRSIKEFRQNQKLQALNYATLGDIYFDRSEYKKSGAYFDSTLQRLAENTRDFRQIKKKRDNLEDVIRYEDVARVNDSILTLVAMGDGERLAFFTEYTERLKGKAIADSAAINKEREALKEGEFIKQSEITEKKEQGKFYFYNPTTVAYGKQEFRRRWGDRRLEDNWRRANKNVMLDNIEEISAITKIPITEDPRFLPVTYISTIPTDEKAIDDLIKERNLAYYQLGLIYQEKFKEYKLAADRLESLLLFTPEERLVLPTKYHLYKIYGITGDKELEQKYRTDIVSNYPETRYAEIIQNPQVAAATDASSPEYKYKELYRLYEDQKYGEVIAKSDQYMTDFSGHEIVPKLELLKATAIGRQEGLKAYKEALNYVALNYPNSIEGKRAQEIYTSILPKLSHYDFEANQASDKWKLVYEFPVASYEEAVTFQAALNNAIEQLNYNYLDTSIDYYTPEKIFVVVHGLYSRDGAKGFAEVLKENKKYQIEKPYFEISSPNYSVIQIHKNLEELNN